MTPHHATEPPVSPPADPTMTASGFTPIQTAAIAELVQEMTATAAEGLRHELSRWHGYLAMYLLGQIGIALLAILMLQALRDPSPLRHAIWRSSPLVSQRYATPIHSECPVNRPRFEVLQSETAAGTEKCLPAASPVVAPLHHPASDWFCGDSWSIAPPHGG